MQMYVSELRYAVPPQRERIDIREPNWIGDCLQQLLTKMIDLKLEEAIEISQRAELYRRMIDALTFVVINYVSVSQPGQIAGRHSATMIDPRNFTLGHSATESQADIREQNSVIFPPDSSRRGDEDTAIRELWFNRWKAYHNRFAPPVRFTLNHELLFSAANPRPIFLSWFEGKQAGQAHQLLTPLALNAPRETIKSWARPEGQPAKHPHLERFTAAFQGMYGNDAARNQADMAAVSASLGRVVEYFGDLGGQCFFSIPATICVHAGGSAIDDHHERCAVISVSLNHEWEPRLYEAAWEFFSGVANQILTDIMNSEYLAYQHGRWERSRANAVYLASHPLKHRLHPLQVTATEMRRDLRALANAATGEMRATLQWLAERADLVSKTASTATKFVNFMNVLADLLDQERAHDAIARCRRESQQLPIGDKGWIETSEHLLAAAFNATDRTGFRTVTLDGAVSPFHVARRLKSGPLSRHVDVEPQLVGLLFGELLQNAANYGLIPEGGDRGAVPVKVSIQDSLKTRYIRLENLIHPDFDTQSADMVARIRVEEDQFRTASGLTVAAELAKQLQLGEVTYDILPVSAAPQWPAQAGSDLHVWRSTIMLEQ